MPRKKPVLAVIALVMAATMLGGCGKTENPAETNLPEAVAAEDTSQEIVSDYEAVYGAINTSVVKITGAEAFNDIHGNPAIRIFYDFTNASDMTTYAGSLNVTGTQNGESLTTAAAAYGQDSPEYGHEWLDVRPGITIRCIAEYGYDPENGDVTFTITAPDSDEAVTEVFDINDLPGAPVDEVANTVTNPTWLEGVPATAEIDGFGSTIAITGFEMVEYDDDYVGIRIFVDFTNNSDTVTSFYASNYFRVMQDGTQMKMPLNVDSTEEELRLYNEVEPGETVTVAITNIITSLSPVEIEFYDGWTHEVIAGQVFTPLAVN